MYFAVAVLFFLWREFQLPPLLLKRKLLKWEEMLATIFILKLAYCLFCSGPHYHNFLLCCYYSGLTLFLALDIQTAYMNSLGSKCYFITKIIAAILVASRNVGCFLRLQLFDAISKSRQTCEKLQCLYENLMSNNFLRTAVLKKIWIVNLSFTPEDSTEKYWGRYMR